MKKNNSKKSGQRFEAKVSKTINSGAIWFSPTDLNYKNFALECKFSQKKGYRVSLDTIEKLWSQALSLNKMPRLIIGIQRNDSEVFILNCDITLERNLGK